MIRELKKRFAFAFFVILHRRSLSAQKKWQLRKCKRLLLHAYAHVPLWRTLLDAARVDPASISSFTDFSRLPITNKHTYIGKMVEEYIDSSSLVDSVWYLTSGSSGTPFRFLMSEHAVDEAYIDFASFRFLWWRGVSLKSIAALNIARFKIRAPSSAHRLFVPVKEYLSDPDKALSITHQFKPDIIAAYPSLLLDMAERATRNPSHSSPRPSFVLSFGEMLFPSARKYIESVMGCEIYDRYGLEEIGVVGVECALHDGFHINTESVFVEIVDEASRSLPEGRFGRIIATDLYNFGMPFIRYDTGDSGKISHDACKCGLASSRIWIEGRYSSFLTFPSRKIHHLEFDGAMDGFMNYFFQYQIVKKSNVLICARLLPGPAYHAGIDEKVRESLKRLVGENISITIELVKSIPQTIGAKSKIVSDESYDANL